MTKSRRIHPGTRVTVPERTGKGSIETVDGDSALVKWEAGGQTTENLDALTITRQRALRRA